MDLALAHLPLTLMTLYREKCGGTPIESLAASICAVLLVNKSDGTPFRLFPSCAFVRP